MPVLPNYNAFAGRHYETGTIANALAWRGARAPHTNQPPSEALLLGISGGITVGYFTFAYEGYPPHLALLTRNTFDPFETLLDRLAIPREVRQTADAAKAERTLIATIEEGAAPIVWADTMSLPYTNTPWDDRNWSPVPLIVFGMEDEMVLLAAGSSKPLRVTRSALSAARGRIKADRFRLMELDTPNFDRLPEAVHKGIAQCIALYTEKPPRGKKENFGLAALEQWAQLLTKENHRQSWARQFPPGAALYQALLGTPWQPGLLSWVMTWGTGDGADRGTYADFLDEAATILDRPALREAAKRFRSSRDTWLALIERAVPQSGILREAQTLLLARHRRFVDEGDAAMEDRLACDARLMEINRSASKEFPMSETEVRSLLDGLAEGVMAIRTIEAEAVQMLQSAMLG
jgi:hypothetical protein